MTKNMICHGKCSLIFHLMGQILLKQYGSHGVLPLENEGTVLSGLLGPQISIYLWMGQSNGWFKIFLTFFFFFLRGRGQRTKLLKFLCLFDVQYNFSFKYCFSEQCHDIKNISVCKVDCNLKMKDALKLYETHMLYYIAL